MSKELIKRLDEIINLDHITNKAIKISPTKDVLEDSGEYLKIFAIDNEEDASFVINSGYKPTKESADFETIKYKKNIPTKEGLANYLGVTSKILVKLSNPSLWEENFQKAVAERISMILDFLQDVQVHNIINRGLNNEYSAKLSEILISNSYKKEEETNKVTNNFNFFANARKDLNNIKTE